MQWRMCGKDIHQVAQGMSIVFVTVTVQIQASAQANEPQCDEVLSPLRQMHRSVEDSGIAPFAAFTSEAWANVHGGIDRGAWYNHLLDFGLELDTGKLGWWQNGTFVIQFHWVEHAGEGSCFEESAGSFNPVSNISAKDHFRVYNLHYAHEWRDGLISLKLGQIATDDDFMGSDYSAMFLNSAFGAMPSQVGTPLAASCGNSSAFPIYSVAAPGLFFRWNPNDRFYSQVGIYHGRIGPDAEDNYGFSWAESPLELGLFWESGMNHKLLQRSGTLRLGLSYHTGPRDDFSGNESVSETSQQAPDLYVIHDWSILETAEGNPKLGWFWRAGFAPEHDCNIVDFYADTGLNWFAPIPTRDADAAGIAISYTRFGDDFRNSATGIAADETTVELTYQAQINRWFVLQADTQFLFNPTANSGSSRETAIVLGLRGITSF